jgi:putative ABC transport system ATP-binding protein
MRAIIDIRELTKHYRVGEMVVEALRGVDLTVRSGEFVAIMGASGSGKSTLLNVLGCLDEPTSGTYALDGADVSSLSREDYADIRNERIGFVFQNYNLLARTSAVENVELPLFYNHSVNPERARASAVEALEQVGLADRMDHEPNEMSGGQQQRVAIARALVNRPSIILADEPTGNLDSRTSLEIMALLQDLNEGGSTIVLVTHEADISEYTKRIVIMRDGRIICDKPVWDRRSARADLGAMTDSGQAGEPVPAAASAEDSEPAIRVPGMDATLQAAASAGERPAAPRARGGLQ